VFIGTFDGFLWYRYITHTRSNCRRSPDFYIFLPRSCCIFAIMLMMAIPLMSDARRTSWSSPRRREPV